ncbi:MAG: tetratricopeptide repeat protein [Bauldia sp.]
MSDVFREVDEDIRREQLRKLWRRFAPFVIAAAILIVAGTAGYRGWEYWQKSRAEANGDRFIAALELAIADKHDESIAALESIATDGSGGYPVLAGFRIAAEKAAAGDNAGAVAAFDAIAARGDTPAEIKNLARLRAALLIVDRADFADLKNRIGDLATVGNPWRHTARELLGLGAWRSGDYAAAKSYFEEINADQETPAALRQRSQLMLALIAAEAPESPAGNKPEGQG